MKCLPIHRLHLLASFVAFVFLDLLILADHADGQVNQQLLEKTSSKIAQERSVDQQYLFVANATEISDIKRKRGSFLEIQSIGSGGSVFGVISDQIQIPFKYPKSFRIDPSANWDLSSTPRRSRRSNAIDWAWRYGDSTLLPLGLTDQVHRSKHGKSASQIVDVNGRGMAIGISTRFKQMGDATDITRTGIQDPFGHSAWLWNGKKTIRIGHYEPEFQSFSGWDPGPNPTDKRYKVTPLSISDAGHVVGYNEINSYKKLAWIYHNDEIVDIGLTSERFTNYKGESNNVPTAVNFHGHVVGWATDFKKGAGSNNGTQAWFFDGKKTVRLKPPADEEYKSACKFWPLDITAEGRILLSVKPRRSTQTTLWSVLGDDATKLGLIETSSELVRGKGEAWMYSPSGFVASLYRDHLWYFDKQSVKTIGYNQLPGADFESPIYRLNRIDDNGFLIGHVFNSSHEVGEHGRSRAWLYDGKTVRDLCLPSEQVPGKGELMSRAIQSNQSGMVIGHSWRKESKAIFPWVFNGTDIQKIEPTKRAAVENDLAPELNLVRFINSRGQVVGVSSRKSLPPRSAFREKPIRIWDAWMYDPTTRTTHSIVAKDDAGQTISIEPTFLSENGEVLCMRENDNHGNNHSAGYYWSAKNGLSCLDSSNVLGIAAGEWDVLNRPLSILDDGTIVGSGRLRRRRAEEQKINFQQAFFLLRPFSPELAAEVAATKESLKPDLTDIVVADVKQLETAKGLASYVLNCVQRNDFEAFKLACLTEADMLIVQKKLAAVVPKEHMAGVAKLIEKRIEQFQNGEEEKLQRQAFDKVVARKHWHSSKLALVQIGKGGGAPDQIPRLSVHCTNGYCIQIRQAMKVSGRWGIFTEDGFAIRAHATSRKQLKAIQDAKPK